MDTRQLVRDKANLGAEGRDWVRRMPKSLDQMHVRVHRAVSSIEAVTGMAILRAIVGGPRDAQELAKLRDPHCPRSEQQIAEGWSGHGRADHLFSLQQAVQRYDAMPERIAAYAAEILRKLREREREAPRGTTAPPWRKAHQARMIRNRGPQAKRQALYRMRGVDAPQIEAMGVEAVAVVRSAYGPAWSRFPTEKECVSHVPRAPRLPKSGGQPRRKRKRPSARTRVAGVFAEGRTVLTEQSYSLRGLLPSHRPTDGSRSRGFRFRQENRHPDLPAHPLGPTLHGRRC